MPSPRPIPPRWTTALSRRATLLGVVGAATAACSPYELQTQRRRPARPTPSRAETPKVDPDVALATTVVAAERDLLERIEATVRRHPGLERILARTRAVHETHVALLEDAVPPTTEGPSEAAGSGPVDPTTADPAANQPAGPGDEATPARSRSVPREPARALRAVADAEDALELATKQAAFAAESGSFARVLASMAAAAAQQSAVLRGALPGVLR